jgi:hypothetical protein
MPIDFADLVLMPAMTVFSYPVTITPKVSQPNAAPYPARGIWTVTELDVIAEDGGVLSNRTLKFGIALNDFTFAPKQGDWITALAGQLPLGYWQDEFLVGATVDFIIDDVRPDGQGGATLVLKRVVQ